MRTEASKPLETQDWKLHPCHFCDKANQVTAQIQRVRKEVLPPDDRPSKVTLLGGGAACRQWQGKLETFFFNLSHLRHCSCSYKQEVLLPGSEGKHCASVQGFSPQQLCENAAWFLFLQCISSSPASAPFVHSAAYTVRPQTLYFWDLEDKFSELKCCPGLFPRNLPENGLLRFDSQWLEP